ncbi:MAG: aldehyde dehydrogenase family protein, partial [Bacillus sp. (in: firmicutes)]
MISTHPYVSGKYLIGGKWIVSEKTAKVINPANTSEVVGEVALCSKADVDQAVGTAAKAYENWSQSDLEDRVLRMQLAA